MGQSTKPQGSDIATIREILVGEDLKVIQASLKSIELMVNQQVSALRQEVTRAIEDVKKEMSREIKNLGQAISNEEKGRIEAGNVLANQVKSLVADVDKKLQIQESQTKEQLGSAKTNLDNVVTSLRSSVEGKLASIDASIAQINRDLRSRKAESSQLSQMLVTMARSIAAEDETHAKTSHFEPESAAIPQIKMPAPTPTAPAAPRVEPAPAPKASVSQAPAPVQNESDEILPGADDFLQSMDNLFKLPKDK